MHSAGIVAAPPFVELERAWRELAVRDGLALGVVQCAEGERSLLLVEPPPSKKPAIALCAGVHGDEPAAPWALLSIVRDGLLDCAFSYRIWPCTNPAGYDLGTRANADGVDVNRSYSDAGTTPESRAVIAANAGHRFVLSLDLHEDYEASGFYCYCYEPPLDGKASLGETVVKAIEEDGLPVEELYDAFELGYPADAQHLRRLERGLVLPEIDSEIALADGLSYSMYLMKAGIAERALTLESPRRLPWDQRIAIHRTAVVNALSALSRNIGG